MDTLKGTVERVTFRNPDSGFTVLRLHQSNHRELITLAGVMPPLQPGETVDCQGTWSTHPTHGLQFKVELCAIRAPSDAVGIEKYLGSGLIGGIGPVIAKRIVDHFGTDTFRILDDAPQRLREIPGVGAKRIGQIKTCWDEQRAVRDVMIFLQSFGVSPAFAQRIYKCYGPHSIAHVRENPYRLARDVTGIGFKTADTIAEKMGIAGDNPRRIAAGIAFVLSELSNEGHVCFSLEDFFDRACSILQVEPEQVRACLDDADVSDRIVIRDRNGCPHIWLKTLYLTEEGIAREVGRLQESHGRLRSVDVPRALKWAQERLCLELAESQAHAVAHALQDKLLIITGGPGTGKSTITKAILAITRKLTTKILLAAPTGRAAKRMEEITGKGAKTIHSLLEWDFSVGAFKRGSSDPLSCDLLIVDEASMIDTTLMHSLLKAVPNHARVIFVGDINQLPSVGPGTVLLDMIASKTIPCVELTEIFRQAAGSQIVVNAHRINQGELPQLTSGWQSDFFFVKEEDPEKLRGLIVDLVKERLPRRYRFDPLREIQVLAPMKRGQVGTEQLNTALQQALNPSTEGVEFMGRRYARGDKVMQTRNNYSKEVFNGDVGFIHAVADETRELQVNFDGRLVAYEAVDLDELALAYAVSVHKYQGSECPCVVIPIHTTHFKLLFRNLIYTAVTRGKRLVVLAGTWKALSIAVGNADSTQRHTGLREQLTNKLTSTDVSTQC